MIRSLIIRMRMLSLALILMALIAALNSCSLFQEPEKTSTANDYIYSAFEEWYLWYDQIPKLDPNDYETQQELIEAIKVPQDRWSFSGSYAELTKLFEGGEYTGFGGGFILDNDGKIKITHVYKDSPFGRLNVERGWIVNSVNGFGVDQLNEVNNALNSNDDVNFVFTDDNGEQHQSTVKKEAILMNTVLYSSIIEQENHKIGYLVFDSFLASSEAELKTEFSNFQAQNITDLVIDLRYNGGGLVDLAYQMVGMIGGDKVAGQTIAQVIHNDKKSSKNKPTISQYDGPKVNINAVYFITTSGSASASELLINSLEPFMDVKLIGSNTHGKPVGMYILSVEELDLAILPIAFKNTNHDGYGDYYDGLPADILEVDDLSHNWGNPEEKMLKTALGAITGVATIASTLKSEQIEQQKLFEYPGIHQFINAY
ncbi:MAG: S41 family peptidase [Prolixibacteraceae bacterium]